jgi:hypothetical protein
MADNTASTTPLQLPNAKAEPRAHRYSPTRLAVAFAIAAASDVASFWAELLPPVQWAIDLTTALLLFVVLGRRWAILPGLITEAIPGMGVFPVWILVVLSVFVYDKVPGKK